MAEKTVLKKGYSIHDFDEVSAGDKLHEVFLKDINGSPIEDEDGGFFPVFILGPASKEVTDFEKKATVKINDIYSGQAKGKKLSVADLEKIEDISIQKCVLIVKKWVFAEECNRENVRDFFTKNPTYRNQIIEELKGLQDFLPNK